MLININILKLISKYTWYPRFYVILISFSAWLVIKRLNKKLIEINSSEIYRVFSLPIIIHSIRKNLLSFNWNRRLLKVKEITFKSIIHILYGKWLSVLWLDKLMSKFDITLWNCPIPPTLWVRVATAVYGKRDNAICFSDWTVVGPML